MAADFPRVDLKKTVCAIATPLGQGGLAVVRLSGPEAIRIADSVFQPQSGKPLSEQQGYTAHFGHVHAADSGAIVDEGIATLFRGPKSFSGEDTVEFSTHGGSVIARQILHTLLTAGAAPAAPGEFTLRAFLNGRIDLTRAEAVAEIIGAKTDAAAQAAVRQLEGVLHDEIAALRRELTDALARLEMGIDFTEEDLDPQEVASVRGRLDRVCARIARLQQGYRRGQILRDGFVVVLAGPPNVGKSTLFNRLAQDERAIVTDIPGTTRDVLREYINCDGWPVCIVDTAGMRAATDLVEQIGVERSGQAAHTADAVVWMIDATGNWESQRPPGSFANLAAPLIVAINKIDRRDNPQALADTVTGIPSILMSAQTGTGIEALIAQIKAWIAQAGVTDASDQMAINDRHRHALARADSALARALDTLSRNGANLELAAFDANTAASALGEIIGTTTTDEILGEIFSNFCIGK